MGEIGSGHPLDWFTPECLKSPGPSQDCHTGILATDSEAGQVSFLKPSQKGKGCSNCPKRLPVLELEGGSYCLKCVGLWFPSWTAKQVKTWVATQVKLAKQIKAEKERLADE